MSGLRVRGTVTVTRDMTEPPGTAEAPVRGHARLERPRPAQPELAWRLWDEDGVTVVEFAGELDERAGPTLADLAACLRGHVVFDLAEVDRVNSWGASFWARFVQNLLAVDRLVFRRCSPAFVRQLGLLRAVRGGAAIASFLAPYVCERCEHEEEKLIEVKPLPRPRPPGALRAPALTCGTCGAPMELDDLPDRYLAFVEDETAAGLMLVGAPMEPRAARGPDPRTTR